MSKKGFRKIDNDTFAALMAAGISGASYQVVLTVVDRTMGFRKGPGFKEKSKIPLTYFQQVTGLSRQSVRLGIKKAEARHIIVAERSSTRPTVYGLNLKTEEWLTRKQNHLRELGNKITPSYATKSPQTRKPAISRTNDAKETYKETPKAKVTPPHELTIKVHHPTPAKEMSLPLYAPKGKAEADSLTNRHSSVLLGEDRATLESAPSAPSSPSRGVPCRAKSMRCLDDRVRH